jgi:hypothetical protein
MDDFNICNNFRLALYSPTFGWSPVTDCGRTQLNSLTSSYLKLVCTSLQVTTIALMSDNIHVCRKEGTPQTNIITILSSSCVIPIALEQEVSCIFPKP